MRSSSLIYIQDVHKLKVTKLESKILLEIEDLVSERLFKHELDNSKLKKLLPQCQNMDKFYRVLEESLRLKNLQLEENKINCKSDINIDGDFLKINFNIECKEEPSGNERISKQIANLSSRIFDIEKTLEKFVPTLEECNISQIKLKETVNQERVELDKVFEKITAMGDRLVHVEKELRKIPIQIEEIQFYQEKSENLIIKKLEQLDLDRSTSRPERPEIVKPELLSEIKKDPSAKITNLEKSTSSKSSRTQELESSKRIEEAKFDHQKTQRSILLKYSFDTANANLNEFSRREIPFDMTPESRSSKPELNSKLDLTRSDISRIDESTEEDKIDGNKIEIIRAEKFKTGDKLEKSIRSDYRIISPNRQEIRQARAQENVVAEFPVFNIHSPNKYYFLIAASGRSAKYANKNTEWYSLMGDTPMKTKGKCQFSVKIDSTRASNIEIGIAPGVYVNQEKYFCVGCFYYCASNGKIYDGERLVDLDFEKLNNGSVVTVSTDSTEGTVTFYVNGTEKWTGLISRNFEYYPCVAFWDGGDCVSFIS